MSLTPQTQRTLTTPKVDDYIFTRVEAFLIDRKARGVASGTLTFYSQKLSNSRTFAKDRR